MQMAGCWADRMVMVRVDSRAGEMAVEMTMKTAGEMAVDWFD